MSDFEISSADTMTDNMDFSTVADLPKQVGKFDGVAEVNFKLTYKHTPATDGKKEKKTLTLLATIIKVIQNDNEGTELPSANDIIPSYFGLVPNESGDIRGAQAFKPFALQFAKALNCKPTFTELLEKVVDVKAVATFKSRRELGDSAPASGYRVDLQEKLVFPA